MNKLYDLGFNLTKRTERKSLLINSRGVVTVIRSGINFSQDFCPFKAHKLYFLKSEMVWLSCGPSQALYTVAACESFDWAAAAGQQEIY